MFFYSHKDVECIPEIKNIVGYARDNIFLCDASGLHEELQYSLTTDLSREHWRRNIGMDKLLDGDMELVSEMDEYLKKLENEQFLSKMWAPVSDVVGALPNVPAYVSGQPLNMRRRKRLKKPAGPLQVFMECTGSSSTQFGMSAKRGAAMLALAHLLCQQRPVELWVCVTFGTRHEMNGLLCKVETMPMDLARAAYMLVELSNMSHIGNVVMQRRIGHSPGSWSYGTPDLERKYCGQIFSRFLASQSEVLYIPAAFTHDKCVSDPYGWLKDMLVKYGGGAYDRGDQEEAGDHVTGFMENQS